MNEKFFDLNREKQDRMINAALRVFAENGYRPIVIERGDNVENRTRSVDSFYRTKFLDTESNIQFGAGGAGTFSDGKLLTRINDPRVSYVLGRFCEFGAHRSRISEAWFGEF